jgi:hypothetical protein
LKTVENVHHVKINFFFSWSRFLKLRIFSQDFDALRFLSRLLRRVEIVEICQNVSRLSRFVKKSQHCQSLLSLKMMKSLDGLRNIDKKIQKSTHFSIKIETNCWETPTFLDLDLDRDFLVWTLMSRQNREVSISTEISQLSRCTFWRCWYFLDCRDSLFDDVEIESLDWDHVETNWDPQGYIECIKEKFGKWLFPDICLAQIQFVFNLPKQVLKPKGYIAALITLILIIKIMNRKRPIFRVRSTFYCLA